MTPLSADSLCLNGVNATVFDRLASQVHADVAKHLDHRGWVCSCVLRQPHLGGEAKHSRIADVRTALRAYVPEGVDPLPKKPTRCGLCLRDAEENRALGLKPARTFAYRIAPELWARIAVSKDTDRSAA